MQYNKQQFNKVNDKKIMKKVKKQWVVVSVASLAVLGGFAVSGTLNMSQPSSSVVAHASQTGGTPQPQTGGTPQPQTSGTPQPQTGGTPQPQTSGTPQPQTSGTPQPQTSGTPQPQTGGTPQPQTSGTPQSQTSGTPQPQTSGTPQPQTSGTPQPQTGGTPQPQTSGTPQSQTSGTPQPQTSGTPQPQTSGTPQPQTGGTPQPQTSGTPQTSQGAKSYENGKSRPEDNSDSKQDQYDATSNGFNDKLNQAQNSDSKQNQNATKDKDAQDYNEGQSLANKYQNVIDQGAKDYVQYGKDGNKSGSLTTDQQGYYNASFNGASTAAQDYNNSTSKNGTNDQYSHYDSSNGTTQKQYSDGNTAKLNSNTNSSVQLASGNDKVTVPDSDSSVINDSNDSKNGTTSFKYSGSYEDAFRYGINYFLSNQGMKDAKSGKWQGTHYDTSSGKPVTKDYYDNNSTYDSSNDGAYYQAYKGSKKAISDQFNSTNYSPLTQNSSNNNSYYANSYDSVVNDNKNGIAYVNNATQLNYVLTGTSASSGSIANNVNNIKINNDLDLLSAGVTGSTTNVSSGNSLTIDAQNHIADFGANQYNLKFNGSSNSLSLSNFKTIYGSNYYGPFASTQGDINFSNINYVGPQMLQSSDNNVYINNNVNVYQNLGSSNKYTSPFNSGVKADDVGNQQNLYINNMTLNPNSNYFGDVSSVKGGNNVQLYGNLTLSDNSNMNLVNRGANGENAKNGNYGIYLVNSSSKLNVNQGANINIETQKADASGDGTNGDGYFGGALYTASSSNINVDNGHININANGNSDNNNVIYLNSGSNVNIKNNGSINLIAKNISNGDLIYNSNGNINVLDNGNMNVVADNTDNNVKLIYGNIFVNNPGKNGVKLSVDGSSGSSIFDGASSSVTANTVKVGDDLYYTYNLNGSTSGSDNNLTYVDQRGNKTSTHSVPTNITINQVPGAYFVGPVNVHYDESSKKVTVSGNAQVSGGNLNGDNNFYIKYSDNKNTDINSPKTYDFQSKNYDDTTKFNDNPSINGGGIVPFNFSYNSDSAPSTVSVLLKYGINGVQITKNTSPDYKGYSYSSVNYNGDKGSAETPSSVNANTTLKTLKNGNTDDIANGAKDASIIESSGNTISPDQTKLSNNEDYRNGYNAGKAGYEAFGKDINDSSVDPNSLNYTDDSSYKSEYKGKGYEEQFGTGFNQAKTDYNNGLIDGKKSVQSGSTVNSDNTQTMSDGRKSNGNNNNNYQAGLNNFNEGYKLAITNPSNGSVPANQQAGFNYGKSVVYGAQSDVKPSEDNQDKLAGYNAAQQAKDDLYKNGSSDNISSPSDVKLPDVANRTNPFDASAYQSAYYGAYEANKYSEDKNPDKKKPVGLDAIAQNSFDKQLGSNDFLSGNGDSNVKHDGSGKPSDAYSAGYLSTQSGFNATPGEDGKIAPNGNAEFDQGSEAKNGYTDAKNGKAPTKANGNSQVEINSYWGAKAGENSPDQPGEDQNVDKNSAAYKSGQSQSQQDTAKGAQDYINDKSQGKTDDQLKPSGNNQIYNQGYNNQKNYDYGFNGKTGDGVDTQSNSYKDGKAAAVSNSDFNKVKDGKSNSTIDENNGALKGFNDAKSGSQFNPSNGMKDKDGNTLTGDYATKYQGAYAKAYAEATDQMNKGAQQYSSDKNNNKDTSAKTPNANDNQDTQSFDQGYNNQKAYDAGLSNGSNKDANAAGFSNNSAAYQAGQKASSKAKTSNRDQTPIDGAGKDANAANPDETTTNRPKENTNNAQDAYDGAKAGYVDGLNGNPTNSNVGKSSDYQQAYNKAYGDMQKSRQDGTNDFFGKVNGNSLNDPNAIKNAASSDKDGNNIDSKAHNNAFAEQQGYAAGLAGQNDNPYIDSGNGSNHDAYDNANKSASQASAGYKAAQNSSDPTSPENADKAMSNLGGNDSAKEAYQAASQAFADAKANKPSDNSSKDANYKNAYNMAYNQNRAAMGEGENDALGKDGGNTNIPDGQYPSDITTASAKALYDSAKGNASQGYSDAMKPSNANNANAPEGSSKEYIDGYNQAKSISAGANAAIAGSKQAPTASGNQNQDQVNAGFNAAQQAIKNGLADAQSGKNKPNNGKFDENQIFSGAKDVPSTARQAYIDAYEGAYNGYNNGLNGGSQKPSSDKDAKYGNDTTYSAAYDNAFKQGQTDIPAPTPTPAPNNDKDDQAAGTKAGQQAFAGGTPLNINHVNFAGKSQAYKDAFTKGYNDSQAGFDAGINGGKNNNSDNPSFKAGYQSAQAYKQGVKDATRGKKPAKNSSDAYKVGYEAYKEGISGKKANKATLDKLAPAYRKAYEKNYQAAHKEYVAVAGKAAKAGRKNAVGNNRIPRSLKRESPAYQAAYMKAFNDYVKRNLPSYVYNLKKVYSHDAPALTRSTRVKKYSKTPRYDRHVFRVLGYKITSSGHVVYRVKGLGWISASDKSVDNVYYRRHDNKKPIQKVRVIKPQGTYIYSSKTFNKKTAVKKMKKGSTVKVERIETVGGITRFYIGDGQYISSNKTIVEHVR